MAHDIFISYSNKDKITANAICAHMEQNGLRCWYAPRDIEPGADWADSIISAINTARLMVLIFTDHSNISSQVLREVSNAVSAGIPIIPFRLTDEEPVKGMRYYLSTVHWLDAMNEDLEDAIGELYRLCNKLLRDESDSAEEKQRLEEEAHRHAEEEEERKKREEEEKRRQQKRRKLILICVAAAIVVAVILGIVFLPGSGESGDKTASDTGGSSSQSSSQGASGATSDNISMDITETYTSGNSQGALQAGGYLATDGKWYYYRSNDSGTMYRMKSDGSGKAKLTEDPVKCISVYDGYVYYYADGASPGIYRMRPDGSNPVKLHDGNAEEVRIIKDRIYYQDSIRNLHLCSMDLDGKNVVEENQMENMNGPTAIDGEYIYFSNRDDANKLYRANLDGSDQTCLVDHLVEGFTIAGNLLYFNDNTTNNLSTYDLSTGEFKELLFDYIYYINVTEDGIYGYSGMNDMHLTCAQLDGMGSRILGDVPVENVCVCGDRIYYVNYEDHKGYIVDLDGANEIEL